MNCRNCRRPAGIGLFLLVLLLPSRAWPETGHAPSRGQTVDSFRKPLSFAPDNLQLPNDLGAASLLGGDLQRALNQFRQVYSACTDSSKMPYHLGLACLRLGAPDQLDVILLANTYYRRAPAFLDKVHPGKSRRLLSRIPTLAQGDERVQKTLL